jgi:protein farnesyltransferase/geranylgeranyltransferase type-1 subunit alpha
MGYFRAILAKKEISMRAYYLTQEVIKYNPGDYNAWLLRRKIIDEL